MAEQLTFGGGGDERPPVDAPMSVPYVAGSETSEAAAERIEPHVDSQRGQLLEILRANEGGLTDGEMQVMAALDPSSERPRRIELQRLGWVRDSGRRRLTRAGRKAVVWEVVP
jgi:hypothetical protein